MADYYVLGVILLAIIALGAIVFFTLKKDKRKNKSGQSKIKGKDRNTIIKTANRRLAQNPKDPEALQALAELYYKEGVFDKAMKTYGLLVELCATNSELNEFDFTLKYALCALKVNEIDEAYKSFLIAKSMQAGGFEVNYNLGYLEYKRGDYEKAINYLLKAKQIQPENSLIHKYLGISLFKEKRYKDAIPLIRKHLDLDPDDKDALFILAQSYFDAGLSDKALRIFSHLRADPQWGPSAALFAGTINMNQRQFDKGIMDFELGLRHKNIKPEIWLELKYRLSVAYIQTQDIAKALPLMSEIQKINPTYKNISEQIKKYRELNSNKNLQTYLISSASDFATLCRKICVAIYPKAKIQIMDVSVTRNEYADILSEVRTQKWEDIVLFRFMRTSGQTGELLLRDLYSKLKEVKAGRGFCFSGGTFSAEAKQFVEARLIDLVEKESLVKLLGKLDSSGYVV